jgi:hypothetical protein
MTLHKEAIRIQNVNIKSDKYISYCFEKTESINIGTNIHIIQTENMHYEEIVLSDKLGVSTVEKIFF